MKKVDTKGKLQNLEIIHLTGKEILKYADDLARLRIRVFRDYPYLYIGDMEYEHGYLKSYLESPNSVLIAVLDNGRMVGGSTAIPLAEEAEDFKSPFLKLYMNVDEVFYFGESVLLPIYRGQGIGRIFFEEREDAARAHFGITTAAFASVMRPDNHPKRPKNYISLEPFWDSMGYKKEPKLQTSFSWKDVDATETTAKPMVFWAKKL